MALICMNELILKDVKSGLIFYEQDTLPVRVGSFVFDRVGEHVCLPLRLLLSVVDSYLY